MSRTYTNKKIQKAVDRLREEFEVCARLAGAGIPPDINSAMLNVDALITTVAVEYVSDKTFMGMQVEGEQLERFEKYGWPKALPTDAAYYKSKDFGTIYAKCLNCSRVLDAAGVPNHVGSTACERRAEFESIGALCWTHLQLGREQTLRALYPELFDGSQAFLPTAVLEQAQLVREPYGMATEEQRKPTEELAQRILQQINPRVSK